MATNTYVALDRVTVGTATPSITFSSISQAYTDLVIVASALTSSDGTGLQFRFNSDSGSNYSNTFLEGNGTSATSNRESNQTNIQISFNVGNNSTDPSASIVSIMNYSNTTTNKTLLARWSSASGGTFPGTSATVGLWRNTAAITSVEVFTGSGNINIGSTFSLYGIAAASATSPKATGGTIYEDSIYWYHAFGASGTFTPNQSLTCDYLVVAGGGGGGWAYVTGGGGAGGLRSTVTATGGGGSLESALSLTAQAYTVTIGAGGAGSTGSNPGRQGLSGSNSVFSTITSIAGGGGGGNAAGVSGTDYNGVTGGSGGGAGNNAASVPGSGTTNQGFAGGANAWDGSFGGGGGGGGAGAVGAAGSTVSAVGGAGGAGVTTLISGTPTVYAGGGGGGGAFAATSFGGIGGGGNGGSATVDAVSGTANRGGGGGGAGGSGAGPNAGGNGGSGIVILRYLKA